MTGLVIGLFASPLAEARSLYRRGVRYKANPRPPDYMRRLFEQAWPEGRFVNVADEPTWAESLADAERVILLYPDPIGLGFADIERIVRRERGRPVEVLNGRRRRFVLDSRTRCSLAARRLLAWTMAAEAVVGGAILIATPALALYDLARGRR